MRRPTPFQLPFRLDWWLIDHARWYRRRYYTPTPTGDNSDGQDRPVSDAGTIEP